MITPINITGTNYKVSSEAQDYVRDKIGKLDHFVPESVHETMFADVKMTQVSRDQGAMYDADVVMHLPNKTLTARDEQLTEQAAIDTVQEKLAMQLRKYKEVLTAH